MTEHGSLPLQSLALIYAQLSSGFMRSLHYHCGHCVSLFYKNIPILFNRRTLKDKASHQMASTLKGSKERQLLKSTEANRKAKAKVQGSGRVLLRLRLFTRIQKIFKLIFPASSDRNKKQLMPVVGKKRLCNK